MSEKNGVTFTVEVTADYLTRGKVRRAVENHCARHRLRCKVRETRQGLDTVLRFAITGSTVMTGKVAADLEAWLGAHTAPTETT